MYILGNDWSDGYLDYRRAEGQVRISVSAWLAVAPIAGVYFVWPRSLRSVWNYIGEHAQKVALPCRSAHHGRSVHGCCPEESQDCRHRSFLSRRVADLMPKTRPRRNLNRRIRLPMALQHRHQKPTNDRRRFELIRYATRINLRRLAWQIGLAMTAILFVDRRLGPRMDTDEGRRDNSRVSL